MTVMVPVSHDSGVVREDCRFSIEGLRAAIELYHALKYSRSSHVKLGEITCEHAEEIKRLAGVSYEGRSIFFKQKAKAISITADILSGLWLQTTLPLLSFQYRYL